MNPYEEFRHLILLIGANPLPNFVVAEYFLQINPNIETIWLIHSEGNSLQAGTDTQAKNLEALLRKRWQGKHSRLRFPLEKISVSDVSDAATIRRDVERKMLKRWSCSDEFHLNYTGGTKVMATHVYLRLQEQQRQDQQPFSYLDANNFRLVGDDYGIIVDELRQKVQIDFEDLIALHGFVRKNRDGPSKFGNAELEERFRKLITPGKKADLEGGYWLEDYLVRKIRHTLDGKLNDPNGILQNWEIKKLDWRTRFELDIILLHGYHLIGLSSYKGNRKNEAKKKGFEIIQRVRQIGGDEARAIIVAGLEQLNTSLLQEELEYELGRSRKNVMALGLADLRKEALYLRKIEKFVLE